MLHLSYYLAAAAEAGPNADLISLLVTAGISASVFGALISGLVTFLINRRNARITERRDAQDSENDVVTRYREQAVEERAQKESAVATIKELLTDSREQVTILQALVGTLNQTIEQLKTVSASQDDIIVQLTSDRDKTKAALARAEERVREQRDQLLAKQVEIEDLLARTRTREEAARIAAETFDIS